MSNPSLRVDYDRRNVIDESESGCRRLNRLRLMYLFGLQDQESAHEQFRYEGTGRHRPHSGNASFQCLYFRHTGTYGATRSREIFFPTTRGAPPMSFTAKLFMGACLVLEIERDS